MTDTPDGTALHELRCLVETTLHAPFNAHRWQSRRAKSHWYELEHHLDELAGPLVAISNRGGCAYMYRDPKRFAGLRNANSVDLWLRGRLADVAARVEAFRPHTPAEQADFEYMLDLMKQLHAAVHIAVQVELDRERGAG